MKSRNKMKIAQLNYIVTLLTVCLLCSCSDDKLSFWSGEPAGNNINIGGVDTEGMIVSEVTTRAVTGIDAEKVPWLVQPLKQGLDITYGLYNATPNHEDVAILKLTNKDTNPATYTFQYKIDRKAEPEIDDENNAIWYNNGPHYFQGVYVPDRIRYTSDVSEVIGNETVTGKARDLSIDQHDDTSTGSDNDLGNYTLLSHYLGMPANFRLTATIMRIELPFRHRLARVVAFVLIDPVLNTTLKGYKKNADGTDATEEDPRTTSFRFCNVKVLNGVNDATVNVNGIDNHTLTPTWGDARKIIPHFDGERGSYSYKEREEAKRELDQDFKFYYKEEANGTTKELYPTSPGWQAVHDATADANGLHNGYTEVNYGKVPVYDVIVRPTYTSEDNVMYDEDLGSKTKKAFASDNSNKIDFEIELENKLRYTKRFEFDLDANYQTVVYLRISREHVDYNDAGADLWKEIKSYDDWYGVDNENGNRLSLAGSSWQRAYTYGYEVEERKPGERHDSSTQDGGDTQGVTDGKFYNASSTPEENEHAQYFSYTYKDMWVERFLQAYEGGAHHGDYFVLCDHITIDARLIPKDFVFTGHLDGQDKTITLTNTGETVVDKAAYDEDNYLIAVPADYSGTLYQKVDENYTEYHMPTLYTKTHHDAIPATYYTLAEYNEVHKDDVGFTVLTEDQFAALPADQKQKTLLEPAYDEYNVASPTVAQMMSGTYYEKINGDEYSLHHPTLYANHPIHHDAVTHQSPSFLFAGLNGTYTTAQETSPNPYAKDAQGNPTVTWEANVHKETNKSTVWVPTLGYRAEVLHTKVASPSTLFRADPSPYTGNVQNCWNGGTPVSNHTPAIPQYK